jgi:hypothetical protein
VGIAPEAVGILVALSVACPVLALNAKAVSNQSCQGVWPSEQAREKQVVATTSTIQLVPIQASRMRSVARLARIVQIDFAAVADLLVRLLGLPPELAVQAVLTSLDGQEEICPSLLELS